MISKRMDLFNSNYVYHGGYCEVREPRILNGKFTKDFGFGFYVTKIKNQAIKWAKRNDTAFVNTYDFIPNNSLSVKKFDEINLEWLHFIRDCRLGKSHNYDIVEGPMADDQVYDWVQAYESGRITDEQFLVICSFKYPTHQICFCTDKAIDCLKFVKAEEV